ncbi:MAG: sigma-70 family RNA polymerase sigma factor [Lachnospiraceae bacterium]|nr:sigma-70 family RNA polymerase sigma factor [Lachnospiraceae bacterium]
MEYRGSDREIEIQKSVDRIYVEHRKKLQIFVRATVKNEYVADDIVQDVFLELLKKYDSFEKHPNQIGWLYRTAAYKIKEYERRMIKQREVAMEAESTERGNDESGYSDIEFKLLIKKILSPEESLRYIRYYIWGYSVDEMAELEGVTANNIRVRLCRLQKKLVEYSDLILFLAIITDVCFWGL